MDDLEYWELSTSYTLFQAALLFCGRNPGDFRVSNDARVEAKVPNYYPVISALVCAVNDDLLEADVFYVEDSFGGPREIDVQRTRVSRGGLDAFFDGRGVRGHFFGRNNHGAVGLKAQMPVKLNAALRAWTAVTSDPVRLRGRSPKQALRVWLVEHASELGLVNRAGEPNETGIEEICKVANWKPEGGATPTPGPLSTPRSTTVADDFAADPFDLDDELPF